MKEGVFFEIGAIGAVMRYLLEGDWKDITLQRQQAGETLFAPIDFLDKYESWTGYFVEASPIVTTRMLEWIPNQFPDNAHFVAVALAGSRDISPINLTIGRNGFPSSMIADRYSGFSDLYCQCLVQTTTLDDLFRDLGVYPDILRLDVELMEVEVLESYSFFHKPEIIQVDHHKVNIDAICDILERNGYVIESTSFNLEEHQIKMGRTEGDDVFARRKD